MRVRVRRRKREDDWDLIYTVGFGSGARSKVPPKFDADVSYLWDRRIYIELAE